MKIIAGALKGRTLKTVSGPGYRPAMGKVRESLFSLLEARGVIWAESIILDLYAGSGSLAFEAVVHKKPILWKKTQKPLPALQKMQVPWVSAKNVLSPRKTPLNTQEKDLRKPFLWFSSTRPMRKMFCPKPSKIFFAENGLRTGHLLLQK